MARFEAPEGHGLGVPRPHASRGQRHPNPTGHLTLTLQPARIRRAYWLKVHEIPDVGPGGKGKSIANLVSMEEGERIAAMLAVKEFEEDKFVVMGSRRGVVKKTALSAFSNPRVGGIIAMGIEEGDAVIAVLVTDGKGEVFIGTRGGMAIRFEESDVRPMG